MFFGCLIVWVSVLFVEDIIAYLELEAVARGLGFTQEKNGVEYVRWETVRKYLADLGVPACWHGEETPTGREGLPDFIPENIFYRLAMKAKNAQLKIQRSQIENGQIPR